MNKLKKLDSPRVYLLTKSGDIVGIFVDPTYISTLLDSGSMYAIFSQYEDEAFKFISIVWDEKKNRNHLFRYLKPTQNPSLYLQFARYSTCGFFIYPTWEYLSYIESIICCLYNSLRFGGFGAYYAIRTILAFMKGRSLTKQERELLQFCAEFFRFRFEFNHQHTDWSL